MPAGMATPTNSSDSDSSDAKSTRVVRFITLTVLPSSFVNEISRTSTSNVSRSSLTASVSAIVALPVPVLALHAANRHTAAEVASNERRRRDDVDIWGDSWAGTCTDLGAVAPEMTAFRGLRLERRPPPARRQG